MEEIMKTEMMKSLSRKNLMKYLGPLCLSLYAVAAVANVPERMTYQGVLVDADGVALGQSSPENYDVVFAIYEEKNGGLPIWGEQQTVTVDKGYFSVLLGEGAAAAGITNPPISRAFVGESHERYIGITVKGIGQGGTDLDILPRLQLVTSPFAFKAYGTVPLGGIIMWSGAVEEIPAGWALCDGSGDTPDLRSRFIVGAGVTANGDQYDPGATGGSDQVTLTTDQMPSHNHSGTTGSRSRYHPSGNTTVAADNSLTSAKSAGGTRYTQSHDHSIPSQGGNQAHENRPPYYAMAFIMRVE